MNNKLRGFWSYGTAEPFQRIGLIILVLGIVSLILWCYEDNIEIDYFFHDYRMPSKGYNFAYSLHIYFIPLGLLLTWGWKPIIMKVRNWIMQNKK